MTQEPIQRLDIIKAGGSFTIDRFKIDKKSLCPQLKQLEGRPVEVHTTRKWKEAGFEESPHNVFGSGVTWMDLGNRWGVGFPNPEMTRALLADLIEASDKEAADVLRADLPWQAVGAACDGYVPRYDADTLAEYGLSADAMLYVGAEFGDYEACDHYLAHGADPLRPTFKGDCAALRGLEQGLYAPFHQVEHLEARHLVHGESFLFAIARNGWDDKLIQALEQGANLEVKNAKGETCLDHLRGEERLRVDEAIAERRAGQLEKAWKATQPTKENLVRAKQPSTEPTLTQGKRPRF